MVVVGGGVAGLEAARMAALRGHRVVLLEKSNELGGQVLLAARAPARAEYGGIVRFLVTQVRKLGVQVRLGVEATPALVLAEHPDAVVIATGSHPYVPPVPGSDGKHVVTSRDVLAGEAKVGPGRQPDHVEARDVGRTARAGRDLEARRRLRRRRQADAQCQ